MKSYGLTDIDAQGVEALIEQFRSRALSGEHPDGLCEAALLSDCLPLGLRSELRRLRTLESAAALLLRGFAVDDVALGPTPEHWRSVARDHLATREEAYAILVAGVLGDIFGWRTQQDGRIVHNVLPIREDEEEQLGSGSAEELWWHTEDAFHAHRADYIVLLCLRNPYGAVTTYATVDGAALSAEHKALLREPAYSILPDNSHLPRNNSASGETDDRSSQAYDSIVEMAAAPVLLPVLFGDPQDPYARLDPYFMRSFASQEHEAAFNELCSQLSARIEHVVLEPGDLLILDNYRAVHGRKPFKARFDGTDRWLKRLNVARDLRPSRALRGGAQERVVYG